MVYSILPIAGFYQFGMTGSVLPDWYTNYYTQEDRLKSLAKTMQRLVKWDDLALEKINELVENVNNLGAADVTALIEQIEELSDSLKDTNNTISSINSAISSINSDLQDLEEENSTLNNRANTLETKVTNLETKVNSLETSVNGIVTRVGNVETNLSNLTTRVSTAESKISTLEGSSSTNSSAISSLTTKVNNNETNVESLSEDYEGLSETVTGHSSAISSLTSNFSSLEEQVETNTSEIQDLKNNSGGGSEGGGEIDPELENRVMILERDVVDISERVDNFEGDIQYATAEAESVKSDITSLQEEVTNTNDYNNNKFNEIEFGATLENLGYDSLEILTEKVNNLQAGSGGGESSVDLEELNQEVSDIRSTLNTVESDSYQALNYGMASDSFLGSIMVDLGVDTPEEVAATIIEMKTTIDSQYSIIQDLQTRIEALENQ